MFWLKLATQQVDEVSRESIRKWRSFDNDLKVHRAAVAAIDQDQLLRRLEAIANRQKCEGIVKVLTGILCFR